MSDLAIGGSAEGAFRARTVALMVAVGVVAFVGMLVLGAYAPDFRRGHNGGGHALSNAAIGYSGLVRLSQATARGGTVIRNDHQLDGEDLLVITPEHGWVQIGRIVQARQTKPTLVVFPKWSVAGDRKHAGWVRRDGTLDRADPAGVLDPEFKLKVLRVASGGRPLVTAPDLPRAIQFHAPRPLQTIAGKGMRVLVADRQGRAVVAQLGGRPLYVVADPDLLDNMGMKDARQAAAALALLDWMNSNGATSIGFDVTLNGFGHAKSPLRLAFEPPFLAMTLALAAVLLLAGLHALGVFGAPRRRERAIAFGKTALVDNTATLIRKARRQSRFGARYAAVMRDRAVRAFGVPARLKGDALDAYLDRLPGRSRFTTLAAAADAATDAPQLLAAARALHRWQGETTR